MKRFLIALACLPTFAQTPDACLNRDLCVSATVLSQATVKALYGPLNKQYGAASVDICSQVGTALTVPLAKIRQQAPAAGVTILPSAIAQAVIANAQGSTKWAKAGRITFAILGGAVVASGVGGISPILKAGLTAGAISGSQIWALVASVPVASPLSNYAASALPELLQFQPGGCLANPGIQLIQGTAPAGASIKFGVTIQGEK